MDLGVMLSAWNFISYSHNGTFPWRLLESFHFLSGRKKIEKQHGLFVPAALIELCSGRRDEVCPKLAKFLFGKMKFEKYLESNL